MKKKIIKFSKTCILRIIEDFLFCFSSFFLVQTTSSSPDSYDFIATNYIYKSVIQALKAAPQRKFNFEHVGFLRPWFTDQTKETKSTVKNLIKNKTIGILNNAAIACPDEAGTYYKDILTNYRAGASWFKAKVDPEPIKNSSMYSIDSFGHSLTTVRLGNLAGMNQTILGRAQTYEKFIRGKMNALTFIWKYRHKSTEIDTLAHLLITHYDYPYSFLKTAPLPTTNPLDPKFVSSVLRFKSWVSEHQVYARLHKNRRVLSMMGSDMAWTSAEMLFGKVDFLIFFTRSQDKSTTKGMKISYSTISEYFEKLREDAKVDISKGMNSSSGGVFKGSKLNSDMFPYINRPTRYLNSGGPWTGFFTSRAFYKRLFRGYSAAVRSLEAIYSANLLKLKDGENLARKLSEALENARWWVGVLTHHDAITGTSRAYVMMDYHQRATQYLKRLGGLFSEFITYGTSTSASNQILNSTVCDQFEVPGCVIKESSKPVSYLLQVGLKAITSSSSSQNQQKGGLNTGNSKKTQQQAQKVVEFTIPNIDKKTKVEYELLDPSQGKVPSRIDCSLDLEFCSQIFSIGVKHSLEKFYLRSTYSDKRESIRMRDNVVRYTQFNARIFSAANFEEINLEAPPGDFKVYVGYLKDRKGLEVISHNNFTLGIRWKFFKSFTSFRLQHNGPYIMSLVQEPIVLSFQQLRYSLTPEYIQILANTTYHNYGTIEIRIWPNEDKDTNPGQTPRIEVIHHLTTNWKKAGELMVGYSHPVDHQNVFYTDSNGLDPVKREYGVGSRFTEVPYRLEHNFYPINQFILLKTAEESSLGALELAVVVDRIEGATVSKEGEILVDMRRRTKHDDYKGMSENLVNVYKVSVRHNIFFGGGGEVMDRARGLQIEQENLPVFVLHRLKAPGAEIKLRGIDLLDEENLASYLIRKLNRPLMNVDVSFEVGDDCGEHCFGEVFITLSNMSDKKEIEISGLGSFLKAYLEEFKGIRRFTEVRIDFADVGGMVHGFAIDLDKQFSVPSLGFRVFKVELIQKK